MPKKLVLRRGVDPLLPPREGSVLTTRRTQQRGKYRKKGSEGVGSIELGVGNHLEFKPCRWRLVAKQKSKKSPGFLRNPGLVNWLFPINLIQSVLDLHRLGQIGHPLLVQIG